MTRGLLLVSLALLLVCGPAMAGSVGTQYGNQVVRPGEGVISPELGDPVFHPTAQQLQGWVNDGINAAAEGTELLNIPGVSDWVATLSEGIPCNTGHLRFAIAVTPQLRATAAGWSAAWEDDLWERIVADQNVVSTVLAGAMSETHAQTEIPFLIGIARDDTAAPIDARSIIWAYGEWRSVSLSAGATVTRVADDSPGRTHPTSRWAGRYVMSWLMYDDALSGADWISVANGELERRQPMAPDHELVASASAPNSGWRLVVGRPEEYAFIDFWCFGS